MPPRKRISWRIFPLAKRPFRPVIHRVTALGAGAKRAVEFHQRVSQIYAVGKFAPRRQFRRFSRVALTGHIHIRDTYLALQHRFMRQVTALTAGLPLQEDRQVFLCDDHENSDAEPARS